MSTKPRVSAPRVRFFDVVSDDGTGVRAWTNDADGPTVLLCNGLGTNPYVWPALLDPDCGIRVVSWNHRGVGGSERPRDTERVGIDAFLEDALAVMRHTEIEKCVVAGWSMGVNLAFELAVRWPEKVTGLFAVAGVPGDTFSTMLGPLHIPAPLAKKLTVGAAWAMHLSGKALSPIARRIPWVPLTVGALRHSGFIFSSAPSAQVAPAVREFLTTDIDWYMHLALHASRHPRVSLSKIKVPATLIAGRWDILAGSREMKTAADRIEDSRYVELSGSHFLPLEHADEIHEELLALIARTT